ncbi:PQQ-binding-like beta-propeller repeat protein [Saccharibacillus sp. O23]|uniref:outer membrane protein assembly factor BamB family protein n=1 Tax=Saccharibacillus sp. O23 TaxID=2009338 RepID=UPI00117A9A78|nr:PQQ-binding-like beta-propeller repeat protein [Saccharibacillus sp. O23]
MNPNLAGPIRRTILYVCAAGLLLAPGGYYGAAPSAQAASAGSAADASAGKYPAVVGTAKLRAEAPLLRAEPGADASWRELSAGSYLPAGGELKLFAREGDWLRAKDRTGASGWIPAWYASAAASEAQATEAVKLTPAAGAKLRLAPGSRAAWAYDGGPLVSNLRVGEWYAVSPATGRTMTGEYAPRPLLLWLKAGDAESKQLVNGGLLKPESGYSAEQIREMLDGLLRSGASEQAVLDLLGEPLSETDARMAFPDQPDSEGFYHWTSGGVDWRYERPDGHLIVRLSDEGRLTGANWILPLKRYEQQTYYSWLQTPDFASVYRPLPLLPSLTPETDWRTRIGTDYAYLEYASEDTLIVRGDDGGFSGMHYSSMLYGLDRKTGKIRWMFDAGWSAMSLIPDPTGESLTVSGYLPKGASPNDAGLIAHVRMKDGSLLWTYPLPQNAQTITRAVGNSIVVLTAAAESDGMGTLVALEERTGKPRWKQQIRGLRSYDLLNGEGTGDPYVLLGQGKNLRALDPSDGRTAWTASSENGTIDGGQSFAFPPSSPSALAKPDGTRWIKFDGEGWRKIDLANGKTLARYPLDTDGSFEDLGGGYLLVQEKEQIASGGLSDSQTDRLRTKLIDVSSGREIWTRGGAVANGLIDGDTLYAVVDRIPSALNLKTGGLIWEARTNGLHPNRAFTHGAGSFLIVGDYLLLPYGEDLLAFERGTGRQLGRLDGFRFGYPELRDTYSRSSLLNEADGKIYIGSASRSFAVLDKPKLIALLDEAAASGRGVDGVTPASRAAEEAAWYPAETH